MTDVRFRRSVFLASCLATLAAAPTARADHFRPFELGAGVGWRGFAEDHGLGRYLNDPSGTSPKDFLTFGLRAGWGFTPRFALEGELFAVPTTTNDKNADLFILSYRAHLLAHIIDTGSFRPFVLAGFGGITSRSSDSKVVPGDTDAMFHVGVGAKIFVTESVGVRLDGRLIVPPAAVIPAGDEGGYGGLDWEALGSLFWAFGGEEPAPPAPKDSDGDGILDVNDKCPNDAEDKDGFQDDDGCPDPDNDGDGILDAKDKCPNDAETKNGIDDEDGCPETDPDGDGLVGSADKCPNEAEDKDGFQDDDGCPDPDNDGDGIPDVSDKCPNQPETKNGYQDEDGCPDEVPAEVAKFTGTIEGINFKTDSAEITKSSFPQLDKAAKVLTDYADLRIEISGHTDDRGKAEHNKDLSQRRADSVKKYLVDKKIDPARIETVGYGSEKPVAENKAEAGRAKNRRIEFKLLTR